MKFTTTLKSALLASVLTATFAPTVEAQSKWETDVYRCQQCSEQQTVTFVKPKGEGYADKIDFAELEALYPLNRAALAAWTAEDIKILGQKYPGLGQEYSDQLYARLTAGPIPNGPYRGRIVFEAEGGMQGVANKFTNLGTLNKAAFSLLRRWAEHMWKGKYFYRDEGVLRNLIAKNPVTIAEIAGVEAVILHTLINPLKLPSQKVDGTDWKGKTYFTIFPAHLYCGQSLLDARRESVVIDYAFSERITSTYRAEIDYLAGRGGTNVRDEIRMVHPGFYLGRAYLQRFYALTFVLESPEGQQANETNESCWMGTQARK